MGLNRANMKVRLWIMKRAWLEGLDNSYNKITLVREKLGIFLRTSSALLFETKEHESMATIPLSLHHASYAILLD